MGFRCLSQLVAMLLAFWGLAPQEAGAQGHRLLPVILEGNPMASQPLGFGAVEVKAGNTLGSVMFRELPTIGDPKIYQRSQGQNFPIATLPALSFCSSSFTPFLDYGAVALAPSGLRNLFLAGWLCTGFEFGPGTYLDEDFAANLAGPHGNLDLNDSWQGVFFDSTVLYFEQFNGTTPTDPDAVIAYPGMFAPSPFVGVFIDFGGVAIAETGLVWFSASVDSITSGLFRYDPGTTVTTTELAEGGAAPGGLTFGALDLLADDGVGGLVISSGAPVSALFAGPVGAMRKVAAVGDAFPGGGVYDAFPSTVKPAIDPDGTVVFLATDDSGLAAVISSDATGVQTRLVAEGDTAAGTSGDSFLDFHGALALSATGEVHFSGTYGTGNGGIFRLVPDGPCPTGPIAFASGTTGTNTSISVGPAELYAFEFEVVCDIPIGAVRIPGYSHPFPFELRPTMRLEEIGGGALTVSVDTTSSTSTLTFPADLTLQGGSRYRIELSHPGVIAFGIDAFDPDPSGLGGLVYLDDREVLIVTGATHNIVTFPPPPPTPIADIPQITLLRTLCSDDLDNDGDGLFDTDDPGCMSAASQVEDPQCNDGIDNDGDLQTDLADPECEGKAWWNNEAMAQQKNRCGLGGEPALLLPIWGWLRRRAVRRRGTT